MRHRQRLILWQKNEFNGIVFHLNYFKWCHVFNDINRFFKTSDYKKKIIVYFNTKERHLYIFSIECVCVNRFSCLEISFLLLVVLLRYFLWFSWAQFIKQKTKTNSSVLLLFNDCFNIIAFNSFHFYFY